MNLDAHLSKDQYRNILKIASKLGTNYFTFNIPNTICNDCDHIDKRYLKACPKCGSNNIDYATRIIGYLKRVSNFSEARQKEAKNRAYYRADQVNKILIPTEND
jgi:ribonucleoside-triphosphate reductase